MLDEIWKDLTSVAIFGKSWHNYARFGNVWQDLAWLGENWQVSPGNVQLGSEEIRKDSARFGKLRQDWAKLTIFGKIWPELRDMPRSDKIWPDLARCVERFGEIWQDPTGFAKRWRDLADLVRFG